MSNDEKRQAQLLIDNALEKQPPSRKNGCRRGCLAALAICLVLSFPLWWIGCHTTPLRVTHETTRAMGPMTSDGKRLDYFLAYEQKFYPPEMQTDENGYRIWVRAVGDLSQRDGWDPKTGDPVPLDENLRELFRRQVYEKLRLDPDVPPTLVSSLEEFSSYEAIKKEAEKRNQENPEAETELYEIYNKLLSTPWTLEEYPFMEDWVKKSDPVLDLLGETVRKPAFRAPSVRKTENTPIINGLLTVGDVQLFRELARTTSTRIRYRLGIGDIDGAIYDTLTLHHLARHTARHGMLTHALVGIAIDGMGAAVGIAENPKYPPSKEQIQRLFTELENLPPFVTLQEVLEAERYFALGAFQDMYWGNMSPYLYTRPLPVVLRPVMSWTVDINIFMARGNEIYDTVVDGTFTDEDCHVSMNPLSMLTVRGRSKNVMNVLGGLLVPAVHAAREAWRRNECTSNMRFLTLALLLYEKEHGHLPEGDWREAVRPYLGANVVKCFQCPTHPKTYNAKDCTTYAMISGVENPDPTPQQILIAEVMQPLKLGQGDGRFPLEKAKIRQSLIHSVDFDGLGSYHTGGANFGFRSGAVHYFSETIDPENLNAMLQGTATEVHLP